jgi:MFS transporter, ACS family, tartrate transporter
VNRSSTDPSGATEGDLERATFRTVSRRLLPLMGGCYFLSYLDRTNLSVAALTMNDALGISPAAFGLGAGLFFLGYFVFEVPSNLLMHRYGARIWMSRIMVTWGAVAVAQALIQGPASLYTIRVLLGIAEAGFFPGMILYLTYWFPQRQRARVVGLFMAAVPLSTALGAPLGGVLLELDGAAGLAGWQWLFVVEGVPTVVLGFLLLRWLTDRPAEAGWLPDDQKRWLVGALADEAAATAARGELGAARSLRHPRVLLLSLVYFAIVFGLYGLGFWMPTIIKQSLAIDDNLHVTLLTAAPYAVGAVAIVGWGRLVDRSGRTVALTAGPMLVGGVALAATAFATAAPWVGYAGLFVCAVGVMTSFPGFWRLPTSFLAGAAAAAGIAAVNAIGNLAGFVGPYWIGWIGGVAGGASWGLVSIGVVMMTGAALVVALGTAPADRGPGSAHAG